METTYSLRPGLTWHDGAALTADDFVFAWRVYRSPALPFSKKPQDLMDSVTASDPRTVVIRWSSPFTDTPAPSPASSSIRFLRICFATRSTPRGRRAAARNRLSTCRSGPPPTLGQVPYRLDRRELRAFSEGVAFPGYALGRPKIDRVNVRAMGDENTVLSNLLAGEIDFAPVLTLRVEHRAGAQAELGTRRARGRISRDRNSSSSTCTGSGRTSRPTPASSTFGSEEPCCTRWIGRRSPMGCSRVGAGTGHSGDAVCDLLRRGGTGRREVSVRSAPNRCPDARGRVLEGWRWILCLRGKRSHPEMLVRASTQFERGQAIMVDNWRQAGLDVQPAVLPNVTTTEKVRQTFPNIVGRTSNPEDFGLWMTSEIGSDENRWSGTNRAGWSYPEYDRLADSYRRSLERSEMDRLSVQLFKMLNDELPGYATYESPALMAFASGLRGPKFLSCGPPDGTPMWDIHEWERVK